MRWPTSRSCSSRRLGRTMRHLTKDQLLDVAEGTRPASALAHLESCDSCRREVENLRLAMEAVASVDVPEPSPLFWEHFSHRLREAVAAEGGVPARRSRWTDWRVLVPAAGFAALAVAAAITLTPAPAVYTGNPSA